METDETNWLLLIHQVPNSPPYLRVKMWRRLQKIGAVPVKNAVYVLPRSDQSLEDFHWIAREILEAGGDASVCEATFIEGLTNRGVIELFQSARETGYTELLGEIKEMEEHIGAASKDKEGWASGLIGQVGRLRQRLDDLRQIDFFSSPAGKQPEALLIELEAKLRRSPLRKVQKPNGSYTGRTWVTRKGIHVDRIASAWLVKRFIDSNARFKFVAARGYRPESGELRFDMFDAEFTHEGNLCTFEVLIDRLNLSDRALKPIAEIIHDIDLKESKFGRGETAGIALVVNAICSANKADPDRLDRGSAVLDDLYQFFKKH